jgi:pyrroloquinoline-quinone synthase
LYTTALYWDYVAKDIPISEIENAAPRIEHGERRLLQA